MSDVPLHITGTLTFWPSSNSSKTARYVSAFRRQSHPVPSQLTSLPPQLGQLNEYTSHFDRYRPQATSSGWKEQPGASNDALYNLGSHVIDQALVLFGKPESVTGFSFSLRSGEGLDDSVRPLSRTLMPQR